MTLGEAGESIPCRPIVLIVSVDVCMQINAEGDDLSTKLLDLLDSERDGLEEPEVFAHAPDFFTSLVFVPPH